LYGVINECCRDVKQQSTGCLYDVSWASSTWALFSYLANSWVTAVIQSARNRTYVYIGTRKRCGACSQRPQCTSAAFRCLAIHMHEPARQRARELVNTPEFANAQRQRKKVEALFAELKNQIGLRRLRLRRMKFVREQFFLAAAAQNIKRLVRFLSKAPSPTLAATA
jgi:Transposase DDE domain